MKGVKLRDIDILPAYSTDEGRSLLKDFYNPVLECAVKYDRVTGFFSPRVFAIAARGFRRCAENGCKIRIITSIHVDDETYNAINEASKISDFSSCLKDFSADVLHTELDYNYLQLFMYLYSTGALELKIAAVRDGNGMFHEKIGIITDSDGDSISFSGSNNETASGWINNVEEFKVFKGWEPVQSTYCNIDRGKFENYWNNESKRFKVVSLSEAESENLIKKTLNRDLTLEEIKKNIYKHEMGETGQGDEPPKRQLRPYQQDAIKHWEESGFVSIFEMATGTGKTFTTVSALKKFYEVNNGLHCIVGVPLISLLVQWKEELQTNFGNDLRIIVMSSSVEKDWRRNLSSLLVRLKMGFEINFALLVPYVTLSKSETIEAIKRLNLGDLVFLADEMHNLVTEHSMQLLESGVFKYRLGLSATPVRLWAPDASATVKRFFGNEPYVFPLERAIQEEFLVPYNYTVEPVPLSLDEYDDYCAISKEIGRYGAMGKDYKEQMESARLKRARIKKNAENKLIALEKTIVNNKAIDNMHHALFYVDNTEMLNSVQQLLARNNVVSSKFTGEEDIDERQKITEALRNRSIDAIVAMKCLDEGVDIPSARNAFFISSNTDPREYVQRLGRVLRLDNESDKTHANVFDFIVIPPRGIRYSDTNERTVARNLVKYEVIRAKFFYELAKNREDAKEAVEDIVGEIEMTFTEDELDLNNGKDTDGIIE